MNKQEVIFQDLGLIPYKEAWDYQEQLLQQNLAAKATTHFPQPTSHFPQPTSHSPATTNHFLLCEHPPVYTLGRNGNENNLLISQQQLHDQQIEFYKINRGGDITFHGPGQVVGYPILDLEKFYTDISRYIFDLEEVIIRTIAEYGILGERSKGETGVWIDPAIHHNARKICAIGIRCSRWITMHGFALNVNTNLKYFSNIIPCGIPAKAVTSISKEIDTSVQMKAVKTKIFKNFIDIFQVSEKAGETL